jgi:hypothetical protein
VHGEARTSERFETWDVLKFIKSPSSLPWMCIGDFNEVLHQHGHEGVADRSLTQMECFQEMIDVCQFVDLGYEGNWWTFEKRVMGGSFCRICLDRALATPEWSGCYPLATVRHLTGVSLDHIQIFVLAGVGKTTPNY